MFDIVPLKSTDEQTDIETDFYGKLGRGGIRRSTPSYRLKYNKVRVDHDVKFSLNFKMFAILNHPSWISNVRTAAKMIKNIITNIKIQKLKILKRTFKI